MAKMKDYIDKAHAVGVLECQERHLARISKRLNEIGVPSLDRHGRPYTVFKRVSIVCDALLNQVSSCNQLNLLFFALQSAEIDEDSDPEEINEFIYSEGDFNG